jgi:glycosyltransferase involved in cell wall biosynthesis
MRVAAVVPAFNEENRVGAVVTGVLRFLDSPSVFVVDDGSRDRTAEAAERAGALVLRHETNQGKGVAIRSGYEAALAAGHDAIVFLDADGQHDPSSIPSFVEAAEKGFELVIGTRMSAVGDMPPLRLWTNRLTSLVVSRLAGRRVSDSQCGYRLATASLLRGLELDCRRYDAESEMIVKAGRRGHRIGEVRVAAIYGDQRSSIHPLVDTGRFLRMIWRSRRWR